MLVTFDMDGHVPAHVYCARGRIRGELYARHWHDLAAIARTEYFDEVVSDRAVATMVAHHKSIFFIEKDANCRGIDQARAAQGVAWLAVGPR